MTIEQVSDNILIIKEDVSAIKESLKSAHKRIDDNDRITEGIHKLAANVEALTIQVKDLMERMNEHQQSMEMRMKAQGERIGMLENKPAKKWDAAAEKVLLIVVGAIVAYIMSKVGF